MTITSAPTRLGLCSAVDDDDGAGSGSGATHLLDPYLHQLTSIYSHPHLVHQHVTHLLTSVPHGSNLLPTMESLTHNDGSSTPPVLLLRGTIPMQYKGQLYHLPVDMYLPPSYPSVCPMVYVRPVNTMSIKPNHKHVGLDGMVYLPYLAEWTSSSSSSPPPVMRAVAARGSSSTSTLKELVILMSRLFGEEPPCFAKPNGSSMASTATATATATATISSAFTHGNSTTNATNARRERPMDGREVRQDAGEQFFRSTTMMREREQLLLLQEAKVSSMQSMATTKLQSQMQALFMELGEEIRTEIQYQKKLEYSKRQMELLRKEYGTRRDRLQLDQRQLEVAICELENWLSLVVENATSSTSLPNPPQMLQSVAEKDSTMSDATVIHPTGINNNDNDKISATSSATTTATTTTTTTTTRADLMALPSDTLSAQLLSLSAECASIDDTIYFLDQALLQNVITLDMFLKEVRRLSKRQFMTKAHMMKIEQFLLAECRK